MKTAAGVEGVGGSASPVAPRKLGRWWRLQRVTARLLVVSEPLLVAPIDADERPRSGQEVAAADTRGDGGGDQLAVG